MANDVRVRIQADDQASKKIGDVGKAADDASGPVGKLGSALGGVAKIAGGFVVAQGLLALPGAIGGAVGAASDMAESLSKVNVVFKDWGEDIVHWADGAAKSFGMSKGAALEAAGTLGNLFGTMGLGVEDAANMSQKMVELAADLGSFNNIASGDALEKLRAGLVGEAEPLRALGVNLNAAMVEAKALEMGLVDANGEVTEAGKVQARYALILEQTATAQGDFARTSDGHANRMKILQAQFADMRTEIGTALLPVVLKLGEAFVAAMPHIQKFVSGGIALATAGFEKARPVFESVGGFVKSTMVPAFTDLRDVLRGLDFGEVTGAFGDLGESVSGMRETLQPVFDLWGRLASDIKESLMPALREVGAAFKEDLGPALETLQPVIETLAKALGVALIGAITALLVVLRELIPIVGTVLAGSIKSLAVLIEGLAGVFEGAFTAIRGVWDAFKGAFTGDWESSWEGVKQIFEGIFTILESVARAGLDLVKVQFETAYEALNELTRGKLDAVVGWFRDLGGRVVDAIGDLSDALVSKGVELIGGLRQGVADTWQVLQMTWWFQLGGMVVDAIGDLSRILWDIGRAIIQGLWDGMKAVWAEVQGWLSGIGGAIQDLKGPIEKDRRLLEAQGEAIMEGLATGLEAGYNRHVEPLVSEVAGSIANTFGEMPGYKPYYTGAGSGGKGAGVVNGNDYPIPFGEMTTEGPVVGFDEVKAQITAASGRVPTDEEVQRVLNGMLDQDMMSLAFNASDYVGGSYLDYHTGKALLGLKGSMSQHAKGGTPAYGAAVMHPMRGVIVINAIDAGSFREALNRGLGEEIMRYASGRRVFA